MASMPMFDQTLFSAINEAEERIESKLGCAAHRYPDEVIFIVPSAAFSAGTIFCMSGDRILMDYSSSLGPIDPQVPDREDKYLVPAVGYLDKVEELVRKSMEKTKGGAREGNRRQAG